MKTGTRTTIALTCALTLVSPSILADLRMDHRFSLEAGGMMSMLASEGTVTTSISGDKSRTDSTVESKSAFLSAFAKNAGGAQITRLDEELMWHLVPEKEEYSEMTFAQMKAMMEQSMAQLESLQQGGGTSAMPVSEADCQWSDPVIQVNNTGEKSRFAGVRAEQHIISYSQTCSVPEREQVCKMSWTMENWTAKRMKGDDEAQAFQQKLAEKLGSDEMLSMAQASTRGLLAMFRDGWGDVTEQAEAIKGYPVKTIMSLEMGGQNCTAGSGEPIAMDDIWNEAAQASKDAAAQAVAAQAGGMVAQETAGALGNSVGGSIAGSAVGAASRELVSGMFKKFGKKKKEEEAAEAATAAPANPAEGMVVLFRISNELTGVSDGPIPPEHFEVPAGWQKVETMGY